jgi:hypothetical protein
MENLLEYRAKLDDNSFPYLDIVNPVEEVKEPEYHSGLFIIRTANSWINEAKKRPIPKMLFSEFWFQSELCILFADTNLGKSILAVQIGDSISTGNAIEGFKLEAEEQKILYFDFELSDKQFENRYSKDFAEHHNFHSNFLRIEIDSDAEKPQHISHEEFITASIEQSIKDTSAKVLIIDNITYLKEDNERAKDALPLMKELKALKKKYDLSILALAHTPKRDSSKPITRNDLQGSKMLINFCDSSFTIGESFTDSSVRYLKQIKQRNTEQIYDGSNVLLCEICKPENFLLFKQMGTGTEEEHLKIQSDKDTKSRNSKVMELYKSGYSKRKIGEELNVSHTQIGRIIDKVLMKMERSGT